MSDKLETVKCVCNHCSQRLEFPANAVGTETQCPACGMMTRLYGEASIPVPPPVNTPRQAPPNIIPGKNQSAAAPPLDEKNKVSPAWKSPSGLVISAILVTIILVVSIATYSRKTTISGQVFIVTQGAESIKLGNVRILLFEKDQVMDFLRARETSLNADLTTRTSELETDVSTLTGMPCSFANSSQLESNVAALRRQESDQPLDNNPSLKTLTSKIDSFVEWRDRFPDFDDYASGILSNVSVTQESLTDADGRFLIASPRDQAYTIFATAQRSVPGVYGVDTETYYWLVDAPTASPTSQIFLSNNNLAEIDPDGYFRDVQLKPKK